MLDPLLGFRAHTPSSRAKAAFLCRAATLTVCQFHRQRNRPHSCRDSQQACHVERCQQSATACTWQPPVVPFSSFHSMQSVKDTLIRYSSLPPGSGKQALCQSRATQLVALVCFSTPELGGVHCDHERLVACLLSIWAGMQPSALIPSRVAGSPLHVWELTLKLRSTHA